MADSPIVHWFPGHMAKATRMITEYIKKVDVVIELLDARIPRSSANPVILELVGQKPHIVLLNKVDLADPKATNGLSFLQNKASPYWLSILSLARVIRS